MWLDTALRRTLRIAITMFTLDTNLRIYGFALLSPPRVNERVLRRSAAGGWKRGGRDQLDIHTMESFTYM